jgi:cell division protein FtsL
MRVRAIPVIVAAIALGVAAAAAYLSFEMGRIQAGYAVLDARRAAESREAKIAELEATVEDLQRQIAILETSREIDRETYAQVERTLDELETRIQAQQEELAFYRSIVSPEDGVAGLKVQDLEFLAVDAERHYLLRLVLVQALVHSQRVGGSVKLTISGRLDGEETILDLTDVSPGATSDSVAYDFVYFQSIEQEFLLPVGFEPATVQVELAPTEPRGDRIIQAYAWSSVSS